MYVCVCVCVCGGGGGDCVWSLFCYTIIIVPSSFAIISLGRKKELVAVLYLPFDGMRLLLFSFPPLGAVGCV